MKYTLAIFLCSFLLFSCRNSELDNQAKRISELEILNKVLNDSIIKMEQENLTNLQLVMLPENSIFEVNKENTINAKMFDISEIHEYNVYLTDSSRSIENRKLLIKNSTNPNFKISYKPKSVNDTVIHTIAEFKINGKVIELYNRMNINVK